MGTFFLVYIYPSKTSKGRMTCGPYLSFGEASTIASEHAQQLLLTKGLIENQFKVEVWEVAITDGAWEHITLKLSAIESYSLEEKIADINFA